MQFETTSYDYIVVGGGSGGAVVAARLSENPANKVLLLEAGPVDNLPWISLPIGFARVLANPRYMWHLETEPEAELNGRRISALRGKVLGGSSSVNGLIYVRGMPSDYSIWTQMGARGWSYENVLPFFRRAERHAAGEDEYHGIGGHIGVEPGRWRNDLTDAFIEAAGTIGIPRRDDFCGREVEGAGYYQMTTRNGLRSSTGKTYLKEARGRANLRIQTDALVTRIEFEGREATGVLFEHGGKTHRAIAGREIVLAAGSFATPQLLQLSGVGPAGLLGDFGIPVVQNLAGVGENLMDHILPKRAYSTDSASTFNKMMSNPISQGLAGLRYIFTRNGPLAIGAALAGGYARTSSELEDCDIQMFYMPFDADDYTGTLPPTSSFRIAFYQNRPESRGSVRIASSDPHDLPRVAPNYYSTEADRRTAVEGMRLIGRIGAAEPLRRQGAREMLPGLANESDDALLAYVRESASTGYHHVGTCRMGSAEDAGAVVDPQLRVHGLGKLRIADGSVMPAMLSANTNAACIMIGERCASFIEEGNRS